MDGANATWEAVLSLLMDEVNGKIKTVSAVNEAKLAYNAGPSNRSYSNRFYFKRNDGHQKNHRHKNDRFQNCDHDRYQDRRVDQGERRSSRRNGRNRNARDGDRRYYDDCRRPTELGLAVVLHSEDRIQDS